MRPRLAVPTLAAAFASTFALAPGARAGEDAKPKKPSLELRVAPRFGFSPLTAFLTAELTGGEDVEELYCPELQWEWDDGGKSVEESDCPPFEAGKTKIERRFTNQHEYRRAGIYNIRVTLRRADRPIAAQSVRLTVRAGLGDPTIEPN